MLSTNFLPKFNSKSPMAKIKLNGSTRYALEGKIVTLDHQSTVLNNGVVYIEGDTIVAVQPSQQAAPDGFLKSDVIKCGGTIYPGMIELHNHLSYNIVSMWQVPKRFDNRDQWRRHQDYRKSMTGPLQVLGHIDGFLQSIVRYVECRLLFSGVTSSQGITLASHGKITRMYIGIVRNVEQSVDPNLPDAQTKIADITDAAKLAETLEKPGDKKSSYLLHLAEGTQESANKHFKALQINANKWAINEYLAGIHACGLRAEDFEIYGTRKGNMVWSPLSNLLLYGVTADIEAAKANNVLISLGSDWTPSGSKNLMCELKVAKLYSQQKGHLFDDEALLRMVTTNAAKILKWNSRAGSIEAGKKADIVVLSGRKEDAVYTKFIEARESSVIWTIVDGIPRYGQGRLMGKFDITCEKIKLGSITRYLYLENDHPDAILDINLSYKKAKEILKAGLKDLPTHALNLEQSDSGIYAGAVSSNNGTQRWFIESDHEDCEDYSLRHHIPYDGEESTGGILDLESAASEPLSQIVEPMQLDLATILEDKLFFKRMAVQPNLPDYIKLGLPAFYGIQISLSDTSEYVQDIKTEFADSLDQIVTLTRFYQTPGSLTLDEKITIIEQAKSVLENAYVHLLQKSALYASNPIGHLEVLKRKLLDEPEEITEQEFHQRMINIFNSLRDLHTTYSLPHTYHNRVAFLPFLIEQYFDENNDAHYVVSKTIGKKSYGKFIKGVEVTHWNGIPIEKAVWINGRRFAGSNDPAQFVRGLDSLTFRPLSIMLPPDEEWVTLTYIESQGTRGKGRGQRKMSKQFQWLVAHSSAIRSIEEDEPDTDNSYYLGYDNLAHQIHQVKRNFFAPTEAVDAMPLKSAQKIGDAEIATRFPGHFKPIFVSHNGMKVGYVRIYSFATSQPVEFARDFQEIINSFGTDELIIDIRNNPGGHIWAAEFILQCLSSKRIKPQPAQFLNSVMNQQICRFHSPSETVANLDLTPWNQTFNEIKYTGTNFSLAYPITPESKLKQFISRKKFKIVLITDALCYSASDIFASGFQDHDLGLVLGIHKNTGAGGANVWSHALLYFLTSEIQTGSRYFKPLTQSGANFQVAIRRTIRVGKNQGIPLEDLGVTPDELHRMTKNDLLQKNMDLQEHACRMIGKRL